MGKSKKTMVDPLPDHFDSLEEAAKFWDTHSTADYEEHMKEVHFDVDVKWIVEEFRVAYDLMREVRKIARQRGLSTDALINMWLKEKVSEHRTRSKPEHKQSVPKHSTKKRARAQSGAVRSVKV